jgi:hypothetical protein
METEDSAVPRRVEELSSFDREEALTPLEQSSSRRVIGDTRESKY